MKYSTQLHFMPLPSLALQVFGYPLLAPDFATQKVLQRIVHQDGVKGVFFRGFWFREAVIITQSADPRP